MGSLALKAKKESSDKESFASVSKDEEYAMIVRGFKKFFKIRSRFLRQPRDDEKSFQTNRDDKNDKSERKCFRCGDPDHLIRECSKPARRKNQRTFVGGSWSDSDDISSMDDYTLDSEYHNLCKMSLKSITKIKSLKTIGTRCTQDVLTIIENKSKVCNSRNKSVVSQVKSINANSNSSSEISKLTHAVNQQTSVVTTTMIAILKQFQATPPPASVKAVEEICVTCGGAHPYYQCLAADGNTFLELRDNIQGYIAAAVVNYNQGNSGYRPPGMANQIRPSGFAQMNVKNNQNQFSQPQGYNRGNNFNQDQSYQAPTQQNQVVPLSELEKIKRVNEANMKAMQTKITVILKNLPEKLRDPGKFLISCGFSELKCKALADLGASINLMPLPVWKKLGLPELIFTRMTLELANRAICTPAGIARDVFVLVGKFTFPADFVIFYYESAPRVSLILGRPFLRTAHALIDVHKEEMIFHDGDERLTLNMRHDTSNYSNQPQKESIHMINICDDSKVKDDVFDPNHVLKPLSPSAIPVKDIDSFLEKSDTSLSYSDISLPEFETFINHTEETNSGSTTTHVDYSLPKYDSFLFKIKLDQGKLTSVVMKDNLAEPRVHVSNVLTTHPTLVTTIHADISLSDLECFNFKTDPGELTSIVDSGIHENVPSATNVNLPPEEDHSSFFAYVVWIFLSFLTYPVVPPNLLSFGNEDIIFNPGISNYHFPSLLPDVSHQCETFMKFNVYLKLLNENPIEVLSSTCSLMEQ
nr:reverse transcriptase domain-containing protein [Tanacetum cinerariifolium]